MCLKSVAGIFSLLTLLITTGPSAHAQFGGGVVFCSNCATEPTLFSVQTTHNLEYAKQLLQYAIQVQQLADAIQNTIHSGPATLTNVAQDLNQLANVIQGGQALAYSLKDQDVVFHQMYPGYQTLGPNPVGPPAAGSYAAKYANWAATTLATTQGLLRGVGVHGNLLTTEQHVLGVLRTLTSSNLLNRNDGINLSGQLAGEQVAQLQKLRELQMEDMMSKAAYQGYVIQRQATNEAASAWFFSSGPAKGDGRLFQPGLH
jgi:P-type conjugative transfer protein TrbJ